MNINFNFLLHNSFKKIYLLIKKNSKYVFSKFQNIEDVAMVTNGLATILSDVRSILFKIDVYYSLICFNNLLWVIKLFTLLYKISTINFSK